MDKAKDALGIQSPSKVFAKEIGEWIPPGIGEGVENAMPELMGTAEGEMSNLTKKMKAAVGFESGKFSIENNISQSYKASQENRQSIDQTATEVNISGETHVHVELNSEEIGNATTPIIDRNMLRIDTHKKRGG